MAPVTGDGPPSKNWRLITPTRPWNHQDWKPVCEEARAPRESLPDRVVTSPRAGPGSARRSHRREGPARRRGRRSRDGEQLPVHRQGWVAAGRGRWLDPEDRLAGFECPHLTVTRRRRIIGVQGSSTMAASPKWGLPRPPRSTDENSRVPASVAGRISRGGMFCRSRSPDRRIKQRSNDRAPSSATGCRRETSPWPGPRERAPGRSPAERPRPLGRGRIAQEDRPQ